jgi:hypothetical protein
LVAADDALGTAFERQFAVRSGALSDVRLADGEAEHANLLSSIGREGRTIHLGGLNPAEVAAFAKNNAALTSFPVPGWF